MDILSIESFSQQELLARLAATPLQRDRQTRPYGAAELTLTAPLAPDSLAPAQRYVLLTRVREMISLHQALAAHGIDLFDLGGGLWIRTSADADERIPVIPPIVEESLEPGGRRVWLIADGLHRVSAARSLGMPISVVQVSNVDAAHPYYAFALPGGFGEVAELEELPDGFQKKEYRQPDRYKDLFRDYNAVLPGVQEERKKSNPDHLRA